MRRDPFRRLIALMPCALLVVLLLTRGDGRIDLGTSAYRSASLAATATPLPAPAWPDDGATDHPIPSTGCGLTTPVTPGTTAEQSVTVPPATNEGFASRMYWIHVPHGYDASRPTALVLVFHGGGGTGIGMEAATGFSPFADQHQFLVVYPQGLPHDVLGPGYTSWAATGPLDSIANGVDDLLFVSNLLDAL